MLLRYSLTDFPGLTFLQKCSNERIKMEVWMICFIFEGVDMFFSWEYACGLGCDCE
jgi:hypothetical protein